MIEAFEFEIDLIARRTHAKLAEHRGIPAIQTLAGVGPMLAAMFVAEIGDVGTDSPSAAAVLLGWADPTPPGIRHQGAPRPDHQARQSPGAVGRRRGGAKRSTAARSADPGRIGDRRGTDIAKVAAARKLLTLVYYGLRDGQSAA